jgi:hypothetical protein
MIREAIETIETVKVEIGSRFKENIEKLHGRTENGKKHGKQKQEVSEKLAKHGQGKARRAVGNVQLANIGTGMELEKDGRI